MATIRRALRQYGSIWGFCAFMSAVITYVGLSTFRPDDTTTDDSQQYLLMAAGDGGVTDC